MSDDDVERMYQAVMPDLEGWERVQFSAECDPDGDGWCRVRDCDPAECDCIGPTEQGVEYREINGVLYGRRAGSSPKAQEAAA